MSDRTWQTELDLLQWSHSYPSCLAYWKWAHCPEQNIGQIMRVCVCVCKWLTPYSYMRAGWDTQHDLCLFVCAWVSVWPYGLSVSILYSTHVQLLGQYDNLLFRWKQLIWLIHFLPQQRLRLQLNKMDGKVPKLRVLVMIAGDLLSIIVYLLMRQLLLLHDSMTLCNWYKVFGALQSVIVI